MIHFRLLPLALFTVAAIAQNTAEKELSKINRLVADLARAESRGDAHRKLLALGERAVPSLIAGLTADDEAVQRGVLAVLEELGPAAGSAVTRLYELIAAGRLLTPEAVDTLAELMLFADVEIDETELTIARMRGERKRGARLLGDDADWHIAIQRLMLRAAFPAELEVETLTTAVGGYFAWRVEAAVDLLGARGPAAAIALPALRTLLERPEPRILLTNRTVPLHRKVARALEHIAPDSEEAALARRVIAGEVPLAAPAPLPERVAQRIDALLGELEKPATREAAAANLAALGSLAAVPVATAMLAHEEASFRDIALGVIARLDRHGAAAVPQLYEALVALPTYNTVAVLDALSQTAPWSRDQGPPLVCLLSARSISILGHRLKGEVVVDLLNAFSEAKSYLYGALAVDPASSIAELTAALEAPHVLTRETALRFLRERGDSARAARPALRDMLHAKAPPLYLSKWSDGRGADGEQVDRSEVVQRLAAAAILAIAAPDDPLVADARRVLAR